MRIATMRAEDLATIGARGQVLAAREFGWASVADKMATLYSWIIFGGTPPEFVEF